MKINLRANKYEIQVRMGVSRPSKRLLKWRRMSHVLRYGELPYFNPSHVFVPHHIQGHVLTTLGFAFSWAIQLAGCTCSQGPEVTKNKLNWNIYT